MTFLLGWDFSIVAEPCPLLPSLLREKELYLRLAPWDWLISWSPLSPGQSLAGRESSWPHLPLYQPRGLSRMVRPCHAQAWCPPAPLEQALCPTAGAGPAPAKGAPSTGTKILQPCSREARRGLWQPFKGLNNCTPLLTNWLHWQREKQVRPSTHCLPVSGGAAATCPPIPSPNHRAQHLCSCLCHPPNRAACPLSLEEQVGIENCFYSAGTWVLSLAVTF